MLNIENKELFGKVIAEALAGVEKSGLATWEQLRWTNAIGKAVAQIEDFGAFMDWQENQTLLIWSDKSNNIYEANGVCQCKAHELGQPCWHRCAARIVKNYFAALECAETAKEVPMEKAPYEQKKNSCLAGLIEDYVCECSVCISKAPYLKPSSDAKPMAVGGIRI